MLKSLVFAFAAVALTASGIVRADDKAAPTDPQIAMIAVVANGVDIDAGKLAAEKTQNPAVKELADMMVRDHTSVNERAADLVKKLGVKPEESAASKSLKEGGDKELAKLKGLSGAAFDKAYVDNEVAYHEAVIGVVNDTLIPNTKNAELKALLESAKPVFAAHLEHAKMVQASLNK